MHVTLTVKQILKTKGFEHCRLLAGHEGLDREISKITIAELPDTLNWLQGGELVCSTAYYITNNPEAQENWIVGMAKNNVAALAIKTERFFGEIPEKMIKLAEEHSFPLIELPLNITWPLIIEGVMSKMLEIQTKRLKQSYNIHEQLTKLVLSSKGIKTIVKTIAELVRNPVILEDRFFNPIAQAYPDRMEQNSSLENRLSVEVRSELRSKDSLLGMIATKRKSFFTEPLITDDGQVEQLILPIFAGNDFFGWLTTLLIYKPHEFSHRVAMEHGSTVLALEFLKEKARFEAQSQARTDFLRAMLENDYTSEEDLLNRANLLGINLSLPTNVFIISLEPETSIHIYKKIESHIISKDPMGSVIERTNDIVVFYHPKNTNQDKSIEEIKNITKSLGIILESNHYSYHIGIGRCYFGPRQIKKSYFEAEQALLKASKNELPLVSYFDLGIERFIALFPDQTELSRFAQDFLNNLIEYDQNHNTKLVPTLASYLKNNRNQAETSRQLHLHINSLNYRLQRIQEILGLDLSNPDTCLMLYLALKFHHLIDHNQR